MLNVSLGRNQLQVLRSVVSLDSVNVVRLHVHWNTSTEKQPNSVVGKYPRTKGTKGEVVTNVSVIRSPAGKWLLLAVLMTVNYPGPVAGVVPSLKKSKNEFLLLFFHLRDITQRRKEDSIKNADRIFLF